MTHPDPMLIVHGGAGPVSRARLERCLEGCRRAARRGWAVLEAGGSALDAAEAAVVALEDDPEFNAGRGAALNALGRAELDASIMAGEGLRAGAVAAVRRIRNPVRLARAVLEDGQSVLLVDRGAERFAVDAGFRLCRNRALVTPRQRRRWEEGHGTVGCVARDGRGRLAAATSTGGKRGDLAGRVGDSAIIGAGTYASPHGAVSCTGIGEDILRGVLALRAVDRMAADVPPAGAVRQALDELTAATGTEAGLIALGRDGDAAWVHNAAYMPVAVIGAGGAVHTGL